MCRPLIAHPEAIGTIIAPCRDVYDRLQNFSDDSRHSFAIVGFGALLFWYDNFSPLPPPLPFLPPCLSPSPSNI